MKAYQAYFGDHNGTHNLLVSSMDDRATISYLKLNSDIPSTVNIDYAYLRGEKVENFYVFTKTMHDPDSERPGMSFSHAIIIPISSVKEVNNLNQVIEKFVTAPVKGIIKLTDLEIDTSVPISINRPSNFSAFIDRLINNKETLVYFGHNDFNNTIAFLWNFLPEKLRSNFSFNIAGSPNEIKGNQLTVVHTPETFDTRWAGFPIIKKTDTNVTNEGNVSYFEHPEKTESAQFYQFIEANSIEFNHIHEFLPIVRLFTLYKQATEMPSVILLKRVIIAIQQLIPNPSRGAVLKDQVINLFVSTIKNADLKEFMMVRNISFEAFANGLEKVQASCTLWSNKNVNPANALFFPEGVKMISESFWGETPVWWNEIIQKIYKAISENIDTAKAKFIWEFWKKDYRLIDETNLSVKDEKIIRENKGQISDKTIYEPLIKFCAKNRWPALHADAVANHLPIKDAILAQIALEKDQVTKADLIIIQQHIGYHEFFKASLLIDNKILHHISAEICVQYPVLLKELDVLNLNWQKIWYEALLLNKSLFQPITKYQQDFEQMLGLAIENKPYLASLIKVLSAELGNVYHYIRRSEIWGILSQEIQQVFLDKTGIFIVENFKEINLLELELTLITQLKNPAFVDAHIVKNVNVTLNTKIEILENSGLLNDHLLTKLLKAMNNQLNYFEANAVAKTINKHNFRNTLEMVYDNRNFSNSYTGILNTCKSMLSKWKQLWLVSSRSHVSISTIAEMIDKQKIQDVFKLLQDLGVNEAVFNRLKAEYVAGVKGIELIDLCDRLKTFVQSLG